MADPTLHDFTMTSIEGRPLALKDFAGKAVLLVNTASACGFTPQYRGLEALHQARAGEGLVVLGVPCNDFGAQEQGSEAEIRSFCETRFGVSFPLTAKLHVHGAEQHPVYAWLESTFGADALPKWNFHKFLFGRDGRPVQGFPSRVSPGSEELTAAIDAALKG